MKDFFVLALTCSALAFSIAAQLAAATGSSTDEWRDQIAAAKGSIADQALDLANWPDQLASIPQHSKLQAMAVGNWRVAVDNFTQIAPDRDSRFILISVFQDALQPLDYLEFIGRAADLRHQGVLDDDLLVTVASPPLRLEGIMADNYKDFRVRALAQKLLDSSPKNKELAVMINSILSGKSGSNLGVFREFDTHPRSSLSKNKVIYAEPYQQTMDRYLMMAGAIAIVLLLGGAIFICRRRSTVKKARG